MVHGSCRFLCLRQSQSDLYFSYSTRCTLRPLRSTRVTPLHHYYGPLRLPSAATIKVIDSLLSLSAFPDTAMGLPGSQLICRRALPSITPGSAVGAMGCYFPTASRLHHIRKDGHHQWCNEAELGSLSLRLTTSPSRGSPSFAHFVLSKKTGLLTRLSYLARIGRSYMFNNQLTRLAHFSQQDQPDFAWRTGWHGLIRTKK